jgi:hypothetical protein
MVIQELQQTDFIRTFAFAERILEVLRDGAHFHLTGSVNEQSIRYWSANNPQEVHQRPLHCERVNVWCGMARFGGRTVTVNSQCYMKILHKFLLPELRRCHIDLNTVWFQQDGATCQTSRESMILLREHFPGHLILKCGDVEWPPRSPDLSACDYFLWGYLKDMVHIDKPRTLEAHSDAITLEIRVIPLAVFQRTMDNFSFRLQQCLENYGICMMLFSENEFKFSYFLLQHHK